MVYFEISSRAPMRETPHHVAEMDSHEYGRSAVSSVPRRIPLCNGTGKFSRARPSLSDWRQVLSGYDHASCARSLQWHYDRPQKQPDYRRDRATKCYHCSRSDDSLVSHRYQRGREGLAAIYIGDVWYVYPHECAGPATASCHCFTLPNLAHRRRFGNGMGSSERLRSFGRSRGQSVEQ